MADGAMAVSVPTPARAKLSRKTPHWVIVLHFRSYRHQPSTEKGATVCLDRFVGAWCLLEGSGTERYAACKLHRLVAPLYTKWLSFALFSVKEN